MAAGAFGQIKKDPKLASAVRGTERMLALIKDLEDCEKLDAGALQLTRDWFSLSDLFDRTIDAVSQQAQTAGVDVVAEPTSLQIYADQHRLMQILINLTTNAIKFSPKGGIVSLAASKTGNMRCIKIKDQGSGVPHRLIDSIFDRFSQVRASDSKVKGGTGLGLAICKSLVQLHGGEIKAESEEGKGSVFSFTIPAPRKQV
jgi:signal transduction histidine kinase